jgi:hypothetical protein
MHIKGWHFEIKRIFELALTVLLLLFSEFGLTQQNQEPYKYDLAICSIFKNEARFMREWIEFHKLVGVQHFYLYNNLSTDNYKELLEPYIAQNEVELFEWPYERPKGTKDTKIQVRAFNDVLQKTRRIAKWVAFLDLDEFLFPVQIDNLVTFLKDYEQYGGLCVNWATFGTSGVESIPENYVMIEYLTMASELDHKFNLHVKSIVRPDRVHKFVSPHYAAYNKGFSQVNSDKIHFDGPFSPYAAHSLIRINHYYTRDIQWLLQKKMPDTIAFLSKNNEYKKQFEAIEWCLTAAKDFSIRKDEAILKYVQDLKKALANN